jgi:tetratricopeptide (TPR) repeat protein
MADLAKTLLGDKLRSLADSRRSGVLMATSGAVSKGVFFRGGHVVFASSTVEADKLGENLIRLGRISRREFGVAIQAAQGHSRRLGQTLVAAGVLTDEELAVLVAHQVRKIVISLFTWTEGETRFHEATDAIPADLALDLSTHRLLLEGARIFPDVSRLERALPAASQALKVAAHPPFDATALRLSPAEKEILQGCADGAAVGALLEKRGARALLVRAVYALLLGGVIEESHSVREESEAFEVDTGTFRLALAADQPAPAATPRDRILKLYESVPRATHYEVLEVAPEATAAEIASAWQRLSDEHDRDWAPLAHDVQLGSLVSTLKLRRRQAFHVLSDRDRRAAYDRSLGAFEAVKDPTVSVEQRHQASRLTRQAQELLEAENRDDAITLLLEGVRVDPHDHTARRLLALTICTHPTLARTAERHFLAVLEADPGDADLRYKLATYYRRAGLPRRAAAECRVLLATAPDHAAAAKLLRTLNAAAPPE